MKIDRAALRKTSHIELEVHDEDVSYQDAFDRGKTQDDRDQIAWIEGELLQGNRWAWAQVSVTVGRHGFEGRGSIGGCSYESETAFRACDYYESLVDEAVEELAVILEQIANDHDIWEHDRVTCIPCAAAPSQ